MKIATHNGRFHADDVFAIATLKLAGVVDTLVRTRDEAELASADLRVDVGRKYEPAHGNFDHHQPGGAGKRANDIPYAAFGLIWKEYGAQVGGSTEIAGRVDEKLVQKVDADDNGMALFNAHIDDLQPYTIEKIIAQFNPSWRDEPSSEEMDAKFNEAVELATQVLKLAIAAADSWLAGREVIREALRKSDGGLILVLERFAPWIETVISEAPEVLFVVFPAWPPREGQWGVQTVRKQIDSFENRKDLPAEWAGKEGESLQQASGVADAHFAHSGRFLAIADSKAGALKLAELAVQA